MKKYKRTLINWYSKLFIMDEVDMLEMSTRNSKVLKIPSKQYYSRIKDEKSERQTGSIICACQRKEHMQRE